MDSPDVKILPCLLEVLIFPVTRAMAKHGERLVYTYDHGLPRASCKPLQFYFKIPDKNILIRNTGWKAMVLPSICVIAYRKLGEHAIDIFEIFIRVPTATHSFDIELEDIIRQPFSIEDTHIDLDCPLRMASKLTD
jgi:hypothetical protein